MSRAKTFSRKRQVSPFAVRQNYVPEKVLMYEYQNIWSLINAKNIHFTLLFKLFLAI